MTEHSLIFVGMPKGMATWEPVRLILINTYLPYDPTIVTLGIFLSEKKICVHTKTCVQMSTADLFIINKK